MAGNTYSRQARSRQRGRDEQQSDALVVALTAQVLICIILLLLAVLVKKNNETRYAEVKVQYNVLVTDPAQGEAALGWVEENKGLQQIFASIEGWISSALSRFGGGEPNSTPEESIIDPGVEEPADDPALEEPADTSPPGNGEAGNESEAALNPPSGEAPAMSFDYDYLDTTDIVYDSALGRGGAFPVATVGTTGLTAPEGSTLAPVLLGGRVQPPVTGLITSEFAYRYHPISGNSDFHTGMDIAAEEGRDILAALPGEVVEVGEDDTYGNYIILQHATNLRTFYGHCSKIIATEGMAVRQGERIAKVGQTGVATGPHLHFSVIVEGQFTDPYWVLRDSIKLVE